jgi:hypothetical protein
LHAKKENELRDQLIAIHKKRFANVGHFKDAQTRLLGNRTGPRAPDYIVPRLRYSQIEDPN